MGLSSKQVSSDGLDWSHTLLQARTLELPRPPPQAAVGRRQQIQNLLATEQLKCPRCDSTNTKFCYYNNYNKSQPRHFCKTCKRHWTKGGTLRNVPVGGGRKNKRLKSSKSTVNTSTTTAVASTNGNIINRVNPQMVIQAKPSISPPSTSVFTAGNDQNSLLLGSNFLQNQANLHFPYSTSNFDTNPSSVSTSFQYNFCSGETMEDSIVTSILPNNICALTPQLWQVPNTSYWNWDDLDTFAPTDLNMPWDDSELKP